MPLNTGTGSPDFSAGMPLSMNSSDVPSLPSDVTGRPGFGGPSQVSVPVRTPTKMGRVAEVASAGAYDPTGGEDTTSPPFGGRSTKFGALMKILAPAMHGAAIGGFEGKSTPGGGFAAANNFYQQQRMRQMMMENFYQQMQVHQSVIANNTAE